MSEIPDFGNCVDVGLNCLFVMQTDKAIVNNLLYLIETLGQVTVKAFQLWDLLLNQ
jgi:hypothetical protein